VPAIASGSNVTSAVALVGIMVTAVVAVFGYVHASRTARKERVAHEFAEALKAVGDYQDLPFRTRRRAGSDSETRAAIADRVSDIHSRLDFYSGWLHVMTPSVAGVYDELVAAARREASVHVKTAWTEPLITTDEGMNLGLGSVYVYPETDALKARCITAMRQYLRPSWHPRRRTRSIQLVSASSGGT
jgi:hypothetical protein